MVAAFQVAPREREILFAGRTDRAIAADLFRLHDISPTEENWWTFRPVYLSELKRLLPGREGQILPGVHDVLRRLSANPAAHLGLLTGNIREGMRPNYSSSDCREYTLPLAASATSMNLVTR